MTDNTTDNTTDTTDVPATTDTTTARKPAKRASARKPVAVGTSPIRTMNDVYRVAKSVTPDNFAVMVAAYTRDHGVSHAARNVGRFSGRRIMDAQNESIYGNVARKLNDVQLLFTWRVDFPAAVGAVFTGTPAVGVTHVRNIRRELFNPNARPPHHGAKFAVAGVTADETRFGPTNIAWPKTAS